MVERSGTRKVELIELGEMYADMAARCKALQEENESLRNDVRKLRIIAVGRTKMMQNEVWNKKQAQCLVNRHHGYMDAALRLVHKLAYAPWYRKLWWAVSGAWPHLEEAKKEEKLDDCDEV